jgi:peroxiredoxin
MNRLKPVFITAFVIYSALVTMAAALAVTGGANLSIWVSVFAASAQVSVYFAWLHLAQVPRTSPGLMGFTIGIFVTTIYSVFISYEQQTTSAAPLLAFVTMLGWMAYITWYSELGDRNTERIKVGKRLPKIRLETLESRPVSMDDWTGSKRLVLFYQGNWSPICMGQIKELATHADRFDALGYQISIVSPQPVERSRQLAGKYDHRFEFLVDKDNAAAKDLEILLADAVPYGFEVMGYSQAAPMPTVIALDEKGKVVYADLTTNIRVRPRPQDMLQALGD